MFFDQRLMLLVALSVAIAFSVFSIDPLAQDPTYHNFADRRSIAALPNVYNVLSNLPFVFLGALGMRLSAVANAADNEFAGLKRLYMVFFIGVFCTGCGSAYYHYSPGNESLLWDRLPMTVVFTAFFCTVVGEYISFRIAAKIFPLLLVTGIASCVYWYVSESYGRGDLRAYLLVQFLPMALIPLIMLLYRPKFDNRRYLWGVLGAYAAAKPAELLDTEIFHSIGIVSGHTLKHLLAAGGVFVYYCALRRRVENVRRL